LVELILICFFWNINHIYITASKPPH
jgi:hypothetical protein